MTKSPSCNIDRTGRLLRLGVALLCFGSAVAVWLAWGMVWPAVVLAGAGAFCLYEAARGWCALRAMGIRTPW